MQETASSYTLSIIIPAYNESKRLLPTLNKTLEFLKNSAPSFEIIVVNDGSSDDTALIVENFIRSSPQTKIISFAHNKGKGAAVREGMLAAKGDYLLFQDADGATPIEELNKLMSAMKEAEIAIGSRAIRSADTKVNSIIHRKLLGRIFNLTANLFAVPGILDTQCGFKLFTKNSAKKIFKEQKLDGFGFDVEILYLARKMGFKVREIAVNWNNMPGTKVHVILDGIKMFYEVLLIRFLHRNINF